MVPVGTLHQTNLSKWGVKDVGSQRKEKAGSVCVWWGGGGAVAEIGESSVHTIRL